MLLTKQRLVFVGLLLLHLGLCQLFVEHVHLDHVISARTHITDSH